jgi:hypothetical protein
VRAELERVKAAAQDAVDAAHRQYRRDLVPLKQQIAVYGEAARLFEADR